jgi:hypothetical protein
MSQRLNNLFTPFHKTQSLSLTSYSFFNFSKPLKEIKFKKSLNSHSSFNKNIINMRKSY